MTSKTLHLQDSLISSVRALRPFIPAKDFGISRRFYEELGFRVTPLGDQLAEMHLGRFSFLLQDFYVEDWAGNFVMHVLVDDVQTWWPHLEALELETKYGVAPPRPPKLEPWGLDVAYLVDPSGVLWHFASRKA